MKINALALEIGKYLTTKHTRVYRTKAPVGATLPYIVFRVESVTNSMPSEDCYANIDIFDNNTVSVKAVEDLADTIDGNGDKLNPTGLNQLIINTADFNAYFDREIRQFDNSEELVGVHLINLRYTAQTYFKEG